MAQETQSSEGRGMLTDAERDAIAGDRTDSYRYKTRSYLKRRIEKVERDAEVLAEHAPELLDELQDAVAVEGDRDASDDGEDTENAGDGDRRGEQPAPGSDDSDSGVIGDEGDGDRNAPGDDPLDRVDRLRGAIENVDLPGSGEKLDERRDALRATVEYLVENGSAKRADFEGDVYPDHPARYETAGSWWKNAIMSGLGDIADEVDAIERADTSGEWRFHRDTEQQS